MRDLGLIMPYPLSRSGDTLCQHRWLPSRADETGHGVLRLTAMKCLEAAEKQPRENRSSRNNASTRAILY